MGIDIREIMNAMSPEDKALWTQHRTEMRRSYLIAHNATLGVEKWDEEDNAFCDWLDIKLAYLFDRSGKINSTRSIIGDDHKKTEEELNKVNVGKKMEEEITNMVTGQPNGAWEKTLSELGVGK